MADHNPIVINRPQDGLSRKTTFVDPKQPVLVTLLDPVLIASTDIVYINRVWDNYTGQSMSPEGFVRWETVNQPDPMGASYPGPGTFGVDTEDYVVETIRRGSGP